MNKITQSLFTALPLLALLNGEGLAHALWIVPTEGGYKIQYGEPGEGLLENKDKLEELGPFQIKDSAGKAVNGVMHDDHVLAAVGSGGISVSALDAPLYGQGDETGRPYWHARFVVDPTQRLKPTPGAALEILPAGKDGLSFIVIKGGKPLPEEGVTMFAPGGWSKSFKTSKEGTLTIEAPWSGIYVLEVGMEEKTPGKHKGQTYGNVYNAYTLSFVKK
jgi:hypothetical protein